MTINGVSTPRLTRARTSWQRAILAAAGACLFAAACATTGTPSGPRPDVPLPPPARQPDLGPKVKALTPPHRKDDAARLVRVGVLLPFSARSTGARAEAQSMLSAAQLALFDRGHDYLMLIPKDTGGGAEGARAAARSAIADGVDVILGPLFAESVAAAGEEAARAGVPVIAFSNDRAAAGDVAYLLSFTPEEEIARLVEFAARQPVPEPPRRPDAEEPAVDPSTRTTFGATAGATPATISNFATLAPDNEYGRRVRAALELETQANGGLLTSWEFYLPGGDSAALDAPARSISRYAERQAWNRSLPEDVEDLAPEELYHLPYDAIVLPAGGVNLLSVAPLLAYYDIDPRVTKFLGTSLWNDPALAREPALNGGWFVAPDPEARLAFEEDYREAFNEDPTRLASLAYDAVALVSHLSRAGASGLTAEALENTDGFVGADGLFRFKADGVTERGLAVLEVKNGRFAVIEAAPQSFTPLGF